VSFVACFGRARWQIDCVKRGAKTIHVESESAQHLPRVAFDIEHAQQHVLARDGVRVASMREPHRSPERASGASGPGERTSHTIGVSDCGANGLAHFVAGRRNVYACVAQDSRRTTALIRDEAEEQVFGADAIVTEPARFDLGQRHGAPRVGREASQLLRLEEIVCHARHHGSIARHD
jgi:hypothetical protein